MVGKRSGKALLREEGSTLFCTQLAGLDADMNFTEGLERTDNNMDLTMWPQVNMINQKNYYTYVLLCSLPRSMDCHSIECQASHTSHLNAHVENPKKTA